MSEYKPAHGPSGQINVAQRVKRLLAALVLSVSMIVPVFATDGTIVMTDLTAPNLIGDSNVSAQPDEGPDAFMIATEYCNTNTHSIYDVVTNLGTWGGTAATSTAGEFEDTVASGVPYVGSFDLNLVPGTGNPETRFLGVLEVGECVIINTIVSYDVVDVNGNPVWGASNDIDDDLVYNFDFWVTWSDAGADGIIGTGDDITGLEADGTDAVTVRNQITAASNKMATATTIIEPDATVSVGEAVSITFDGVNFGLINQGFDADGDGNPDYDLWFQAIGESGLWDPDVFQLVGIEATILGTGCGGGRPDITLIAFDTTYFSGLDAFGNCAWTGSYTYSFVALSEGTSTVAPYQEAASGADNEKYNSDYCGDNPASEPDICITLTASGTDLQLSKSVSPENANPGDTLTWSVNYINAAVTSVGDPDSGFGLIIDDFIPVGTTYVAGSAACGTLACQILYSTDGGVSYSQAEPATPPPVTHIRWLIDEPIAGGTDDAVTFQTTVDAGTSGFVDNLAGITMGGQLPFIQQDSASACIGGCAELAIDKDTTTPTAVAGGQATYTIFVENAATAPAAAIGISVSDTLPSGFSYASTTSIVLGGTALRPVVSDPTLGDTVPAWGQFDLQPGDSVLITFVADIDPTALAGVYQNTAQAIGGETVTDDGSVADDGGFAVGTDPEFDENVTIAGPALTVDKDTSTPTAVAGGQVTYSIVVANSGSSNALNVQISDNFPSIWTYASSIVTESGATRTVVVDPVVGDAIATWGTWTITPGGSVTISVVVDVSSTAADGTYDNTADVTSSNHLPIDDNGVFGGDSDTPAGADPETDEDVTLQSADVSIVKTDLLDPVPAGFDIVYELLVTNEGPLDATGIVVVDTLPVTSTFVSATSTQGSCAQSSGVITCGVGDLTSGSTATITVTIRDTTATLTNTAAITSTSYDGNPSNDSDIEITSISAQQLIKASDAAGAVTAGQTITYTVIVNNTSGGPLTNIVVDDPLPTGTSSVPASTTVTVLSNVTTTASDDFSSGNLSGGTGWIEAAWVASGVSVASGEAVLTTSGDFASRSVNLVGATSATVSLDYTYAGYDDTESVLIEASSDGLAWTVLEDITIADPSSGSLSFDITGLASATTFLRVSAASLGGGGPENADDQFTFDNVVMTGTVTTSSTLPGGDPSAIFTAPMGYVLPDGDSITIIYQVVVDDPLDPLITEIVNTASLTSDEIVVALIATATDSVQTPPVAVNDESLANPPGPVSLSATGNDTDANGDLDASTVSLVGGADTDGDGDFDTLVVAGEGTWSVDASGTVTFTPEAGFTGDPTPITYTVSDALDQVSNVATITVDYVPAASDDSSSANTVGDPVVIDVLANDTTGDAVDPTTVQIVGTASPGDALVVAGEGTWSVDAVTGAITFTPEAGFTDNPTPIRYTVDDAEGHASNPATVTVDYQGGSISGTVFDDLDGDGVQDAGELGLSGVVVQLLDAGGTIVATTTTDASGDYTFGDILPYGDYTLQFVPLADYSLSPADQGADDTIDSDPNSATGLTAAITLDATTSPIADVDAGMFEAASIGDTIWLDTDGDGVQDIGEPGIAGVTLELAGTDIFGNPVTLTTTTDANGHYSFDGLVAGTYAVTVTDLGADGIAASGDEVLTDLALTAGSSTAQVITVAVGEDVTDADVGYVPASGTAVIGDSVWSDADADGIQDAGEVGIAGVTVTLLDSDGAIVATTTTAADGSYLFTNIPPGDYVVQIDATNFDPAGALETYTATTFTTAPDDSVLSDPITVVVDGVYTQADFGFDSATTLSLANTVWNDVDGDGVQDAGEIGIAGVTVNLLDTNGDIVASTTTDANGDFTFGGLVTGDYTIEITDDANLLSSSLATTIAAANGSLTLTVDAAADAADGSTDGTVSGTSFGYNQPGTISGVFYSDADGDGIQDAGEAGLGGISVELRDSLGAVVATTTTAADGSYSFTGLLPDDYTITVLTVPTGTATEDPDGTATLNTATVTLAAGDSITDADFGYQDTALLDVSGSVFDDLDTDGVLDAATESGIAGVTLVLIADTDGDSVPDTVIATTTTDANGDYTFADLPDGVYTVAVTDDSNVLDSYTLTSGLDQLTFTVDLAADTADGSADGVVSGNDFGYVATPQTASIGNLVWMDSNGDGIASSSESGISGVTVELFDAGPDGLVGTADDVSITTATTDADGQYLFAGLDPGNYYVTVDDTTLPGGAGELVTTAGTTDPSALIALAEGEIFADADFGYIPAAGTATVGDAVWYDSDGDGLQDAGEIGIGGITIEVIAAGVVVATTTTDTDGSWLITGLLPGDYVVRVVSADIAALGYDTQATNMPVGDDQYFLTVAADETFTSLDFGYNVDSTAPSALATIGDTVYFDADGDGVQDAGEAGIAGVTVNLVDPVSGDILATTTTDSTGNYEFSGLAASTDYQAVVTDIDGVLAGLNATQTPPATISINAAGDPVDTADFGFAPSAGTGTIGDFVWLDFSGDGIQDAGEPGIEGVTLELWLDVNNDGVITPGVDNRVRTASTDANGEYLFSAVPAGNYLVQVTDDGGVLAGLTQTGDPDEGLVTCVICDELADITLLAGDNALAADFGYQTPVAASLSINGTVFEDADENQTYDSGTETPVAGAVVSLYRLVNGELVLWGTTTTDINGDYSFAGLPEGDYVVEVDVAGTTADGFSQTTQAASGGSQSVTLISATGDAVDQDFGFFDDAVITNPVTLRSFRTLRGPNPGDVAFEWSTATELGNVGFNLYAQQDGEWVVVNLQPIPSKVLDAVTVQQYSYQAYGVAGTEFILEDIDIKGQATRHGPFKLNRQYGQPQAKSKKIDWQKIRKEHESKKRMRKQNKGKRMQDKLERIKKRRVGVVSGARDTLLSMLLSMFVGTATAADLPPANSSLINFEVTEDGVHRVTYEDMRAAGLDLAGIDVDQISLTNLGESVPVRVEGAARKGPNSARKFGRGGYIEFIGEALDTLYTGTNVYELHIDDPNPARITADKAQPPRNAVPASFYMETVRVEDELLYSSSSPNGDPWYAAWMLAWGRTFQRDFSINIDQYAVGAAPVTLTVGMWGVTDWPDGSLDHHVKLSLNGVEVADEWFDGTVDHPVSVAVNGTVSEGANTVHVEMPLDTGFAFDVVSLDQYSLTYPRRFIANNGRLTFAATADKFRVENLPDDRVLVYRATAAGIQRLTKVVVSDNGGSYSAEFAGAATPATYHVVTQPNLSAVALTAPQAEVDLTAGVAEYLIITHPDFIGPELDLIVQQRQGRYSVKVVDVEDIYAQLNGHVVDANAIRDYIAFAQQNMNTRYVLLVGGDSYDYRDYLGLGTVSFVPSLYAQTDDLVRYAPVDALYADVDRDNVPDLAIGRFPVRNTAELSAIVNQTLVYEQKLYGKTAVFAADEFDIYQNYSFSDDSENMVDTHLTPRGWDVTRAYIDGEFGLGVQEARNTLIDSINNGVALTSFFGHSGTSDWTFAGLFNSNDAAALQNIGRPTVVTQWGCWNTYYVSPYEETLGHRFMLNADRGAAAVLGASTLTGAAAEHELADQVFSRIMEPGVTMGEAILNAKRAYAQDNPDQLDVILGWTQLGDPALVIQP